MHPELLKIGGFTLHSFGVMILLGFQAGLAYAMQFAKRSKRAVETGVTPDHVFNFAMGSLFLGIVGARILYILLNRREFDGTLLSLAAVWKGGISVHGAIVASILFMVWFTRRYRLNMLVLADLVTPGFCIGYAVGRIGCFLNGCCHGHACDLPWAVRFHVGESSSGALTPPSHPTQLYATAMNLGFLWVLHRWSFRPRRDGEMFVGYLLFYAVYRFIDEQFRRGATARVLMLGLTEAQVFSLVMLIPLGLWFFHVRRGTLHAPDASDGTAAPVSSV
jgi:phosphatidylglycerol:prolipoprotein diacylglycerol transferase